MSKKILTLLFMFFCVFAQAQNYTYKIKGKIIDKDQNPVADAHIQVLDQQTHSVISDQNGTFDISTNKSKIILKISKIGFDSKTVDVSFSGNENRITYVNIFLQEVEIELDEIVVFDNPSLVTNSKAGIERKLNSIAGGVILTDLSQLKNQKTETLKDALGREPGIIIQEFFGGNDQPRLNVRGSGIQSNPQSRGIMLLQDGIPVNFADGSYIIGVLEPQASHLVEIYKGANGFEYGSATLGGAINFITKNGYNASPISVKLQKGSYDSFHSSFSSGFSVGKNDLFVATSYNHSDGFRVYNSSKRFNALLNMGRRFSDRFESRLFVNYTDLYFDISGPLTKAQMLDDNTQVNGNATPKNLGPNVLRDKPNRDSKILRIGNKNKYVFNRNASLQLTLYYQYADDTFSFPISTGIRQNINNDFGASIIFEHKTLKNSFSVGGNVQYGEMQQDYFVNQGNADKSLRFADNDLKALNYVAFLHNSYKLLANLQAVASLQVSWNNRQITDNMTYGRSVMAIANGIKQIRYVPVNLIDKTYDFFGINPKIGFIYSPTQQMQIYTNFSRSYEPPTFIELTNINGGGINSSPTDIQAADLSAQKASTIELGTRGKNKFLNWNVSIYRSWVENEILSLTDLVGIAGQTINSPVQTIHQGAEIGLEATILKNIIGDNDYFKLGAVYNFSDFYFAEGELYKGNQIAGIPRHYALFSADYKHSSGFFLNFNTESSFEKTQILHQNSDVLYQDPYTLLNARIGFQKHKWGFFIEGRNLSDKIYASSYLIRDKITVPSAMANLGATTESFTSFIPGVGRNFTIGINYTF